MHILSNFLFTRYYGLLEKLETLHADPSKAGSKPFHYDGDHERRRKEQLVSFLFLPKSINLINLYILGTTI